MEDAHRQFIDPVLGASGDELERAEARPSASEAAPPRVTPRPPDAPSIAERLAGLE